MIGNSERRGCNAPLKVSLVREISFHYRGRGVWCQSLISELYVILSCVRDRVGVLSLLLLRGLVRKWWVGVASGARSHLPSKAQSCPAL